MGCTGVHLGCEQGVCGACTVIINGRTARSCLMLGVQAAGASIVTVEGLAGADGRLHPIQQAFQRHARAAMRFLHAGHDPGRRRAARRDPLPSPSQVREALSGNLCRCTGYENIVSAVVRAAEALRPGAGARENARHQRGVWLGVRQRSVDAAGARSMTSYIGKDVGRLEDHRFVTGTGTYMADVRLRACRCLFRAQRLAACAGTWPWMPTRPTSRRGGGVLTAADLDGLTLPFTRQFYSDIDPILETEYGLGSARIVPPSWPETRSCESESHWRWSSRQTGTRRRRRRAGGRERRADTSVVDPQEALRPARRCCMTISPETSMPSSPSRSATRWSL